MRYIDRLKTIHNPEPDNALVCGSAIDKGIEKTVNEAIKYYYSQFNIIDDRHIHEEIKILALIPKVKTLLKGFKNPVFQYHFCHGGVQGYIDLITENEDGTVNIYDFKYSNNIEHYLESPQVHIYKVLYEAATGKSVKEIGYIFIPKTSIRQKNTETLQQFRKRLNETLSDMQIELHTVSFSLDKVLEFYIAIGKSITTTEFLKNPTKLCNWCEYKELCFKNKEENIMLPSTERRKELEVGKKTVWVYGAPFSGKTTFANAFPTPLMLNTDGNIKFVDAPFIAIKDEVSQTGRITNRKFAWELFKDTISELELKQNDFKTIIVDLLEDVYDQCRVYMYDKMNIEHESDNSFKAWDMIRNEFLREIKRLMALDYDIVLISHEDASKDVTKRNGDKITRIAPNLQEKAANKVAGMVDIVARSIAEGGEHTLNFKSSEVIFGGGRLKFPVDKIPLDYAEFLNLYKSTTPNTGKDSNDRVISENKPEIASQTEDAPPFEPDKPQETTQEVEPPKERKRRSRKEG